jgi:hypothetical protein
MIGNKLISIFLLAALASTPVFAQEFRSTDWGQRGDSNAYTFEVVEANGKIERSGNWYIAKIGHGEGGQKAIYFSVSNNIDETCNPSTFKSSNIAKLQGQAVKVFSWCRQFSDLPTHYIEFTSETPAGDEYVINLFKNSLEPIKIEFANKSFSISPIGFQAEWEKAGGDAL